MIKAILPALLSGAAGCPDFSSAIGERSTTFSSEDEGSGLLSFAFSGNGWLTWISLWEAPGPAPVASATSSSFSA